MAEELAAELDGEDELTGGDHDEHPTLSAKTLALSVGDVGVELPGGWRCHQTNHENPRHADGMFRWQWEDMLHEESIQLDHLPKDIK